MLEQAEQVGMDAAGGPRASGTRGGDAVTTPRPPARRRFLIVQIDGLSHGAIEQALRDGTMPALARLLDRGALRLHRIPVGLPTSTPAFQAAVMYGGPVDIPAFEFLDKRTGEYHWFPQPWTSDGAEVAHRNGGAGIMRGGRTYGCVFGGDAADCVITFSHMLRVSPGWWQLGPRHMVGSLGLLPWHAARLAVRTLGEVVRSVGRRSPVPHPVSLKKRLLIRWLRDICTEGIIADVATGLPALWVDFVGYDEIAHARGPQDRHAWRELRRIDRSLRRISAAVRRVPQFRYDVFVLSDHGQIASVPFEQVSGGQSVGHALAAAFGVEPDSGGRRPSRGIRAGSLCFVPAGPNVNIYLTEQPGQVPEGEIEARYPGALNRLSRHPGIGLVLARTPAGLVCCYRGTPVRTPLPPGPTGCPLFDRPDRELVLRYLGDLLAMPSAGDVVLFGHYTAQGCVSFLGERGSHAGPSEEELYGFLAAPPSAPFDFAGVAGPRDLYPLFAGYASRAQESPAMATAA
jgi:hypothetical protein